MQETRRCVIVGAANIKNYASCKTYLADTDFYAYCDGALRHQEQLGAKPNLIVGDFDSFKATEAIAIARKYASEIITLPRAKDDTDSMYAAKIMLKRGYRQFVLIGLIGERMDHSLANIALLLYLYKHGCQVLLVDDYAEYEIVGRAGCKISDKFAYFSLLTVNGDASQINITGAKFPLTNGCINCAEQYATSNEVLKGQVAEVKVGQGELLLMRLY